MTLILILFGSSILGIVLGGRLILLLRRFTPRSLPPLSGNLDELPTVSVCIPARNETHAMTQCLERVVATSYPKLEIIVLDDGSADNTSILIKSFAHAGVRFVEGKPLPEGWLGKNHALQTLYGEASGQYILFLDVDTHLSPQSIDQLMAIAVVEEAQMVSILPTRDDTWRGSVLFATLRHFWSVITHTRHHPAATSSAWLVQKDMLDQEFEGLRKLRAKVAPELAAARTASIDHKYRFFISTSTLGVSYEKKWLSQCETSIRLLYPFFGGRIIFALLGVLLLTIALIPFLVVPFGLFTEWQLVHTAALIAACIFLLTYVLYVARIWKNGWLIGGLLFPIILTQELCLLLQSIYAYATHTVTWKGRPITFTARDTAIKQ